MKAKDIITYLNDTPEIFHIGEYTFNAPCQTLQFQRPTTRAHPIGLSLCGMLGVFFNLKNKLIMDTMKNILFQITHMEQKQLIQSITMYGNTLMTLHEQGFGLTPENDSNYFFQLLKPFVEKYETEIKEAQELAHIEFENRIIGEYRLAQMIKESPDNEFIIDDIISDYSRIIKKLEQAIANAKTYKDNNNVVKEIRLKDNEEIILFFEKKLSRKNKQYIVGLDENKNRVSLSYAYLWNYDTYSKGTFEWKPDTAYLIRCNGLYKKRKKDIGYYTFSVTEIKE